MSDFPNEAVFSDAVRELALMTGWQVHRDPTWRETGADEGWPDFTLVRAPNIIFAELKMPGQKESDAQREVLDEMCRTARRDHRVRVFTWFPADWPEIEEVLR
jgi:hypothetical protein